MEKKIYKKIYKTIKKYNNIVVARHIGADPDALGAQLALRETIKNKFPNKKVYAIGNPANRFRFMGLLDKIEEVPEHCLLIVLDTPDIKRIDDVNLSNYEYIIKIDHHPFIEKYADIEIFDENASSACQLIYDFIKINKLKITEVIAENIYLGLVSDTNRFLHDYTSARTFQIAKELVDLGINFKKLYQQLYAKPLNEIKFQGYIYSNMTITENGLAYINIKDDLLKEFGVDSASAGNMINDLNFVNEILIWVFFTEDIKSNLIRANIRSRGPFINDIASRFNGGGHKYASGARLTSWKQSEDLIKCLDEQIKKFKIGE